MELDADSLVKAKEKKQDIVTGLYEAKTYQKRSLFTFLVGQWIVTV
jgi:hypothetical protein